MVYGPNMLDDFLMCHFGPDHRALTEGLIFGLVESNPDCCCAGSTRLQKLSINTEVYAQRYSNLLMNSKCEGTILMQFLCSTYSHYTRPSVS